MFPSSTKITENKLNHTNTNCIKKKIYKQKENKKWQSTYNYCNLNENWKK